jgi:SAM-dependent methyltransferase
MEHAQKTSRRRLSDFIPAPKFRPFLGMKAEPFDLLDVGCGNRSPSKTKRWFPSCRYYGIDKEQYNNPDAEYTLMNGFFEENLDTSDLSGIPDTSFDVIIMAHVIEHLNNGERVVHQLSKKLRPGGRLYLEFPSERSVHLPSGADSLNFHDDPTHVRLYTIPEVTAACEASGLTVTHCGTRRDPAWLMVDLITLPFQAVSLVRNGKFFGPLLWDLLGFASFVIAMKPKLA